MKSITFVIALASSAAACAQSSVTLFGVADATVKYGSGSAGRVLAMGSGGNSTSRIGLRGSEDLGNGWRAAFLLEAGQQMNSGAFTATNTNNQSTGTTGGGGLTFNRQSTVSLLGHFGELRLGRDKAATYRNISEFDPIGDVGVGATLIDSAINPSTITRGVRVSNSVNYFLPTTLGGFYGQAQYYFGENATDVVIGGTLAAGKRDGTGSGIRLGYSQGPLNVAASYGRTTYRSISSTTGDMVTANLGASYDWKFARLMAVYDIDRINAPVVPIKGSGYLVGAVIPLGVSEIRASYASYTRRGSLAAGNKESEKLALGYVYSMSKRTAVYFTAAYLKNRNGAGMTLNSAQLKNPNDSARGYDFGLRHSF